MENEKWDLGVRDTRGGVRIVPYPYKKWYLEVAFLHTYGNCRMVSECLGKPKHKERRDPAYFDDFDVPSGYHLMGYVWEFDSEHDADVANEYYQMRMQGRISSVPFVYGG